MWRTFNAEDLALTESSALCIIKILNVVEDVKHEAAFFRFNQPLQRPMKAIASVARKINFWIVANEKLYEQ